MEGRSKYSSSSKDYDQTFMTERFWWNAFTKLRKVQLFRALLVIYYKKTVVSSKYGLNISNLRKHAYVQKIHALVSNPAEIMCSLCKLKPHRNAEYFIKLTIYYHNTNNVNL